MAAVELSYRATLYDLVSKSSRQVMLVGEAFLTNLSVGGGPIYPPEGGGQPPGIWGGGNEPFPTPPIPIYPGGTPNPPGIWGPTDPRPTPPIFIPPQVPPGLQPPEPPQPGDPTTPVPPPAGSGGWPVHPITPPPYIVVQYPGIGPVVVAPPETAAK